MGTITAKGKLLHYLKTPLYMFFLYFAGSVALFFYSRKVGAISLSLACIYGLLNIYAYIKNKRRLSDEIIGFAVQYGTVQGRMLREFQIPYAILENDGRVIWMNHRFSALTGKDEGWQKSITSIFKEITRENIERAQEDQFIIQVQYEDKIFNAHLNKMDFTVTDSDTKQPDTEAVISYKSEANTSFL